jgi:hypothetical protein
LLQALRSADNHNVHHNDNHDGDYDFGTFDYYNYIFHNHRNIYNYYYNHTTTANVG